MTIESQFNPYENDTLEPRVDSVYPTPQQPVEITPIRVGEADTSIVEPTTPAPLSSKEVFEQALAWADDIEGYRDLDAA